MKAEKPKFPIMGDMDDFVNKAPLKNNDHGSTASSFVPPSPAPPATSGLGRQAASPAPVEEDPLVFMNVKIPLSLRTWLNITALQNKTNLTKLLTSMLEKCKKEEEEKP